VSKGTLYLYFSCKEEIFREALRERVTHTLEGLAAVASDGPPDERLDRFIDAYWLHLGRPSFGASYRLLLAELRQFPDLSRFYAEEVSGRVVELLAGIIRDGVKRGAFRRTEPHTAARMIVALLVQHAIWMSHPDLFPRIARRKKAEHLRDIKRFAKCALAACGADPEGHTP